MDNTNDLQDALKNDKQNLICAWEKFTKAILNAAEALNNYFEHANDKAIQDLLKRLERKKGRWIEDADTYYKAVNEKGGGVNDNTPYFTDDVIVCSECLAMFSVLDNCTEDFDFCPHCGADMRGERKDG